jgi:hypothetical protein
VNRITGTPSWLVTSDFGLRTGRSLFEDPAPHGERVAGIDRFEPPQLVDSGRAEPGLLLVHHPPGDYRHGHCAGVPAARREPAEMGFGRRLVGEMEGLRIVFAREVEHLLASHLVAPELGLPPDLQILEIDHHTSRHPDNRGLGKTRAVLSRELPAFAGMR